MLSTVGLYAAPPCLLSLRYLKRVRIPGQTDDVNSSLVCVFVSVKDKLNRRSERARNRLKVGNNWFLSTDLALKGIWTTIRADSRDTVLL